MNVGKNITLKAWNDNERKYEDLEAFTKQRSIEQAVRADNDSQIPIALHDVFILRYYCNACDDLHTAFTTPYNLFNWCRAYNSGLLVCIRMDAAFKPNRYKMCMYFMGFGVTNTETNLSTPASTPAAALAAQGIGYTLDNIRFQITRYDMPQNYYQTVACQCIFHFFIIKKMGSLHATIFFC